MRLHIWVAYKGMGINGIILWLLGETNLITEIDHSVHGSSKVAC